MEVSKEKKEKIMRNAEILRLRTELLIQTCNGWLPPEEGLKNMAKCVRERDRAERKAKIQKFKNSIIQKFNN